LQAVPKFGLYFSLRTMIKTVTLPYGRVIEVSYDIPRFVNEVLEQGEYSFLNVYETIIDIGCNIGTFSLYMSEKAKHIYAIDLAERNIDCLKETIIFNNLENIKPFVAAISGDGKPRVVDRGEDNSGSSGVWKFGTESKNVFTMKTLTLEQFMDREKIEYADLVKIDVEGAEREIVNKRFPKDRVGIVIGESHAEKWNSLEDLLIQVAKLESAFERLGYHFLRFGRHFVARKR